MPFPPDHGQEQIKWHSPEDIQRSFYKPGVPFRTAVSTMIVVVFLLTTLIVVWFSMLAGIILFICAGIVAAVELSLGTPKT